MSNIQEAIVTRIADGPPAQFKIVCPQPEHDEPVADQETLQELGRRNIHQGGTVRCCFGHPLQLPARFPQAVEVQ